MKKIFGGLMLFALLLTSCQTQLKTARTAETSASLRSVAVADLEVADERITYTLVPGRDIQRGGLDNVKQAAEQEALTKYGNADVLLDPHYVITKKRSLFGTKVTSVTVSGRPAHYRNFRTLDDSVWTNPAFNGVAPQINTYQKGSKASLGGFAALRQDEYYRNRGFEWGLDASAMYAAFAASNDCDHCYGSDGYSLSLLSSFGYRFNPHFYLGAGVGLVFNEMNSNGFIPLYLNARYDFFKRKNTFFLDAKVGYTLADVADESIPGAMTAWALGYSFGKWEIAIQYMALGYEKDGCESDYYNDYCDGAPGVANMLGLRLGYRF